MRIINKRRIAAAAVAAAAVTCIAGPAAPAGASTPILHAIQNQVAHQCTVIGTDNLGNKGVVCADLNSGIDPYGTPEVVAQAEIICETSSGTVVQCAEVAANGVFANAYTGAGDVWHLSCGYTWGPCSTGRNYLYLGSQTYPGLTASNCLSDLSHNIWAVVFGVDPKTGNYNTAIKLPGSGKWVYLTPPSANDSGNESTGHYYICP